VDWLEEVTRENALPGKLPCLVENAKQKTIHTRGIPVTADPRS
jgi:hypothetical protein